jgi:hypothetical protein
LLTRSIFLGINIAAATSYEASSFLQVKWSGQLDKHNADGLGIVTELILLTLPPPHI